MEGARPSQRDAPRPLSRAPLTLPGFSCCGYWWSSGALHVQVTVDSDLCGLLRSGLVPETPLSLSGRCGEPAWCSRKTSSPEPGTRAGEDIFHGRPPSQGRPPPPGVFSEAAREDPRAQPLGSNQGAFCSHVAGPADGPLWGKTLLSELELLDLESREMARSHLPGSTCRFNPASNKTMPVDLVNLMIL